MLVLSTPGRVRRPRGSSLVANSFIGREEQVGFTSGDESGGATIDGTTYQV